MLASVVNNGASDETPAQRLPSDSDLQYSTTNTMKMFRHPLGSPSPL
jgi:hypothetical protein